MILLTLPVIVSFYLHTHAEPILTCEHTFFSFSTVPTPMCQRSPLPQGPLGSAGHPVSPSRLTDASWWVGR